MPDAWERLDIDIEGSSATLCATASMFSIQRPLLGLLDFVKFY